MPTVKLGAPFLLVLLVVVPVLSWLLARDGRLRRLRLARLVDLALVSTLVAGASEAHRRRRGLFAVVAVVALSVAAAVPLWPSAPRLLPRQGLDVLFVVDVSRSMRARDVRPDRLERAKAEISAALDDLAEHRVGVVAFAGSAFVQCPLTTDMEAVRLFLRDLSPDSVPQGGSALSAGLEVARNAFLAEDEAAGRVGGTSEAGKAGRVVVVVSDGEDHELLEGNGDGLKPIGEALKSAGASVVVIGVGSTLGEPIPLTNPAGEVTGYLRDRRNQPVVSRMSPEILGRVAGDLDGTFVDGTAAADLGLHEVFARIAALEKRELEARTVVDYADASWPLLLVALLGLLAWLLGAERARAAEVP
jgi:Ca-activated chloride channel homolog